MERGMERDEERDGQWGGERKGERERRVWREEKRRTGDETKKGER